MWDFRIQTHTPTGKNLKQAFDQLDMLKDKLGLSQSAGLIIYDDRRTTPLGFRQAQ